MAGVPEDELLEAARRGDERAFHGLVEPRRAELQAHCYRMLGSLQDAEDVLQEALLRIWRGLPGFEGRSSLRVWMYRVVTNACLTAAASRVRRVLPLAVAAPADPNQADELVEVDLAWMEPYPTPDGLAGVPDAPDALYEQRESVELAFVAALQHLPPNERAALLLREVLGFSAREIAAQLETSTGAVTSALQRARRRVGDRLPSPSQQEVRRSLGDEGVRTVVERWVAAMNRADVTAVLELLTEDATWSMPPMAMWFRGRAAIGPFLERWPFRRRWRRVVTSANGQPAVAGYMWNDDDACFQAQVLDVLALSGNRIAAVTAFIDEVHVRRLGLPDRWPD